MKIRRREGEAAKGDAGGWFEEVEAARRLYLGHPGRHSPRSIAKPARAVRPLARAADYLTRLAHCPTDINYFINHLLYQILILRLTLLDSQYKIVYRKQFSLDRHALTCRTGCLGANTDRPTDRLVALARVCT